MRKLICLLVLPMMLCAQESDRTNGIVVVASYGIGEGKIGDVKTMTYTVSSSIGYEFYLNQKISLTPVLRHGSNRLNLSAEDDQVFIKDRFLEPALIGRHYFSVSNSSAFFLGINLYGRWSRERTFESTAFERTETNLGWNFGLGFNGGGRIYLQPKAFVELGIGENHDLVKSYGNAQDEFRLNQVSLYVGLFYRI